MPRRQTGEKSAPSASQIWRRGRVSSPQPQDRGLRAQPQRLDCSAHRRRWRRIARPQTFLNPKPTLTQSPASAPQPAPQTPPERILRAPAAETTAFARTVAASLAEKQAEDIAILDVSAPMAIVDYFIVATVRSTRQAQAIAKELDLESKRVRGRRKRNQGGPETEESNWVLLDFDDVVVHIFLPEARTYYGIENLFADVPRLEAPTAVPPAEAEQIVRPTRRRLRLSPPAEGTN